MKFCKVFLWLIIVNIFATGSADLYAQSPEFSISGKINIKEGYIILNQKDGVPGTFRKVGEYKIQNGAFNINETYKPDRCYFFTFVKNDTVNEQSLDFIIDQGHQTAIIEIEYFRLPKIANSSMAFFNQSKSYKDYKRLIKDENWLSSFSDSLKIKYNNNLSDSLSNLLRDIKNTYVTREESVKRYIFEELKNERVCLFLLCDFYFTSNDLSSSLFYFNNLSKDLRESPAGKTLFQLLEKENALAEGKTFPELFLKNLKTRRSENINVESKYTLIDFWWSGCSACIKQFPFYKDLNLKYGVKGFEIITISVDETKALKNLENVRSHYPLEWKEYLDENSLKTKKFNFYSFPTNFLIDKQNRIIHQDITTKDLVSFLDSNL